MNLKIALPLLLALATTASPNLSAADLKWGEWAVQFILTAEAEGLEDPYNTLGHRWDASRELDDHDLPELSQTWSGTYLSVIFYRPEWDSDRETYNTDYHRVEYGKSDEWTFEVRSDDPTRDLSLTWVGQRTGMRTMALVDLQEDIVFPAVVDGEVQTYNFRMNGTVREFAWRVLSLREYLQLVRAGREGNKAARLNRKSNWLPKGWGQGEGRGHRRDSLAEGLPEDPFGD
ncbi:Uncharacterised protein [Halioglobus japonicus]|nr:Uncharacterised protein [Halioglobus japonicus]